MSISAKHTKTNSGLKACSAEKKIITKEEKAQIREEKARIREEKAKAKALAKEEKARIREEKAKAKKEKARIREEKTRIRVIATRIREEKKANDMIANPMKYYKRDLKRLSWDESDASFYKWLAVQAKHTCAPNHAYLKDFHGIWTGTTPGYTEMMNSEEFDEQKSFYVKLAQYKHLM